MRILTMNLWARRGAWADRRAVLIAGLRGFQPDIVAFQEAIVTDTYDQVTDLLGHGYHLAHQAARESDGQGISIASRWPLGDVREVDLHLTPRTADFACTTLIAEVSAPDPFGPVLFVNHFPSWQPSYEHERTLQAEVAARVLESLVSRSGQHVVLAGDLDAAPDATSIRFWTGHHPLNGLSVCYRDAWASQHPDEPGDTFTPLNPLVADWDWPFRRIDYILVRCGDHGGPTLAIESCARIFHEPLNGTWASDHFGLTATLAVPPSR